MFYTVAYVLTSLASFGMVMLLSREGFEADQLDDFKGLNQRSPWWAFMMLLVMFSLAGMPPTVGFYAKFSVIQAAVDAGFVWLAVVAVMASLVGAFYYLRDRQADVLRRCRSTTRRSSRARDTRVLLSANGLALLAVRHPAAAADGAVRRRARAVAVPLIRVGGAAAAAGAMRDDARIVRDLRVSFVPMRVGLFVTCLVDLMRPSIGFAAIRLLEAGGAEVVRAADADLLRPAGVQLRRPRRREGAGARRSSPNSRTATTWSRRRARAAA